MCIKVQPYGRYFVHTLSKGYQYTMLLGEIKMKNVEEIKIMAKYYGIVTTNCASFNHAFNLKNCAICKSNRESV